MRWFGNGKQCCEKSCNFSSPPTYYCERICVLCICVLYKSKSNWISQYICSQIAVIHCGREGSRSSSSVKLRNVCLPVNLKGAQIPACLPLMPIRRDEQRRASNLWMTNWNNIFLAFPIHFRHAVLSTTGTVTGTMTCPRHAAAAHHPFPGRLTSYHPRLYIIDTLCSTRPRTKKLMCFSCVYKINKRASIKIFLVRNNFANSYTISIDSSHRVAQRVCQCHLMEITKLCKYALNSEFMQIKIMSLLSSNK